MLIRFANTAWARFKGVVLFNAKELSILALISLIINVLYHVYEIEWLAVSTVPAAILGGGLAIFLAFHNNAAYDRWWEARKIWGGIVNYSRTFGRQILSLMRLSHARDMADPETLKAFQQEMIYRHIAWLIALKNQLRGLREAKHWEEMRPFLAADEFERMIQYKNPATQLVMMQGLRLADGLNDGLVQDFRLMQIDETFSEFYNLQGKCERIKNTVFPYYYNFFTEVFIWIFSIILPFSFVGLIGWLSVPLCIIIPFVFLVMEKSGDITQDPFENAPADTPMAALVRTIEIDLREMLGETELPPKWSTKVTPWGGEYLD